MFPKSYSNLEFQKKKNISIVSTTPQIRIYIIDPLPKAPPQIFFLHDDVSNKTTICWNLNGILSALANL
jgi:hypothetical protein